MKDLILAIVSDLVGSFIYYDRQEDEDLPTGCIESAIIEKDITIDEIVDRFKSELIKRSS